MRTWMWPMLLAIAAAGLALGGCSSFHSEWDAIAADQGRSMPTDRPSGLWEGQWNSDTTEHEGPLQAIVTQQGDRAHIKFFARYARVFTFEYELDASLLPVPPEPSAQPAEATWALRGSADLGWLAGGIYAYDGLLTPTKFRCKYKSPQDDGVFFMQRPRIPGE